MGPRDRWKVDDDLYRLDGHLLRHHLDRVAGDLRTLRIHPRGIACWPSDYRAASRRFRGASSGARFSECDPGSNQEEYMIRRLSIPKLAAVVVVTLIFVSIGATQSSAPGPDPNVLSFKMPKDIQWSGNSTSPS